MPALLDCPQMECWAMLFAGSLPPDQQHCYESHLESCPVCQERLHQTEDCGDALRRLNQRIGDPTTVLPDPILADIVERLRAAKVPECPGGMEAADLYFLQPTDQPGLLGTLGEYEVQEVIGQGGMGIVLKAFEPALHRMVAIKVLAAAVAGSATARRRFTREAQAAAAVCHEHIVPVHGVREVDGLPYLVMQYVAGKSLQDRLDRSGPLEVTEIVRIGFQTASGLAAAHGQGLIHRDIKPANILLQIADCRLQNGNQPGDSSSKSAICNLQSAICKITDFGLARTVDDVQLTQDGVVAGTPEYMAPEQAQGAPVDHRADLFSLGSVLYALCTGVPPFRGPTPLVVFHKLNEQHPTSIRTLNPEVPAWLEQFIARLLAKDPKDRFQSAAEVAELLEKYLAHLRQPASVSAPPLPSHGEFELATAEHKPAMVRRLPPRLGLLALVLLAMVVLPPVLWQTAADPKKALGREFYQDFRGGGPLPDSFKLYGENGADIRREAEGLRITVPRERQPINIAGVVLPVIVQGDFEITASYQLLQAERPSDGHGVGFEIYLIPDTAQRGGLGFSRLVRIKEGDVYWSSRMTTTTADDKEHYKQHSSPAAARSGQLRLVRTGEEVTFWAAEGAAGEFKNLFKHHLGPENVKAIRLVATPGWAPNAVDVCVKDVRVRTLESAESLVLADDAGQAGYERPRRSLPLVLALGLLGSLLLAVVFALRHSRRVRQMALAEDGPDPAGTLTRPMTPVAFPCPSCGKSLRATPQTAGKKCKCPHCGQQVLVPSA